MAYSHIVPTVASRINHMLLKCIAGLLISPCQQVDTLCAALERNKDGKVMKALKERGVGETTILGQWWCKGLFLGGKACLYQSENEEAVACLKKGSKVCGFKFFVGCLVVCLVGRLVGECVGCLNGQRAV